MDRREKYRKKLKSQGLVRFEIQIEQNEKSLFDQMVNDRAHTDLSQASLKSKLYKTRRDLFGEMLRNVSYGYAGLKKEIQHLKEEISALSPSFFKTSVNDNTPLPQAISSLDNDPQLLKTLLAKTFRDAQAAKRVALEHKRKAEQFQQLHEAVDNYNESLKDKLAHYENIE